FARRIVQHGSSMPVWHNGYYYYSRFHATQNYPLYCRKKDSLHSAEEIVLDTEQIAAGLDFCSVQDPVISPDGQIAAYALDTVGRRSYSIFFKHLATGRLLPDVLTDTTDNLLWADNNVLFYVKRHPVTLRHHRVYRHLLNTDSSRDVLIYEEPNESVSSYI